MRTRSIAVGGLIALFIGAHAAAQVVVDAPPPPPRPSSDDIGAPGSGAEEFFAEASEVDAGIVSLRGYLGRDRIRISYSPYSGSIAARAAAIRQQAALYGYGSRSYYGFPFGFGFGHGFGSFGHGFGFFGRGFGFSHRFNFGSHGFGHLGFGGSHFGVH